jgi:hypothetical protein
VDSYAFPREDINAPDLYIPSMAFVTYILLVGFVYGTISQYVISIIVKRLHILMTLSSFLPSPSPSLCYLFILFLSFFFFLNRFTPELLGLTASKGLAILGLEVMVIKMMFYLFNCGGVSLLDLTAYSGYKFVG